MLTSFWRWAGEHLAKKAVQLKEQNAPKAGTTQQRKQRVWDIVSDRYGKPTKGDAARIVRELRKDSTLKRLLAGWNDATLRKIIALALPDPPPK